jgi:hypothetical protein
MKEVMYGWGRPRYGLPNDAFVHLREPPVICRNMGIQWSGVWLSFSL